jgi:HEAT repeat protein
MEENMSNRTTLVWKRWAWASAGVLLVLGVAVAGFQAGRRHPKAPASIPAQDAAPEAGAAGSAKVGREALRYEGKSFEQWRERMRTELSPARLTEGIKAFGAFGNNGYATESVAGVLDALAWLSTKEYGEAEGFKHYPLAMVPAEQRAEAAVIRAAVKAIEKIGTAAVPPLVAGAKHRSSNARFFAVSALSMFRTEWQRALPALLGTLKDTNPEIACRAIQTLWEFKCSEAAVVTPQTIRVFCTAARTGSPPVRCKALESLRWLEVDTKVAVPLLIEVMRGEKDREVRKEAMEAVLRLGANARPVLNDLLLALKDQTDEELTVCAITALGELKVRSPRVLSLLRGAEKDARTTVREAATQALAVLEGRGGAAAALVPPSATSPGASVVPMRR